MSKKGQDDACQEGQHDPIIGLDTTHLLAITTFGCSSSGTERETIVTIHHPSLQATVTMVCSVKRIICVVHIMCFYVMRPEGW